MWSRPTFPNGPITYYMVYFREGNVVQNQPITDNGFNTTKTSTPTTSMNVTGLKPYTNYTIHVRAIIAAETLQNVEVIDDDLVGAADTEIVMRTNGTIPDIPVFLGPPLSGPSSTTIQIQVPITGQIETGNVL